MMILFLFIPWISDASSPQCPKDDEEIDVGIVIFLLAIHILAGLGIFMIHSPKPISIVYTIFLIIWFNLSVTAGLHRLYTHQTYKAHPLMDMIYNLGVLLCVSSSTKNWVQTHKIHHRYSDTCEDPHYADKDSFYYSHFGWIYRKRSKREEDLIGQEDLDYLDENPWIVFQDRYYVLLTIIVQAVLLLLPLLWGDARNCFWLSMMRIVICLNSEFSVNSLAHAFGNRPYDPDIRPAENPFVSMITSGEGYHNYHHLYPKDFRASDSWSGYNPTTSFILFLKKIGLASECSYFSRETRQWEIQ